MSSITFGRNSSSTYGLIVAPYEIPAPPVQTNYVSVPGRDGSLICRRRSVTLFTEIA